MKNKIPTECIVKYKFGIHSPYEILNKDKCCLGYHYKNKCNNCPCFIPNIEKNKPNIANAYYKGMHFWDFCKG